MFEEEFAALNLPITRYTPQTYDAVWTIAMALYEVEKNRKNSGLPSISSFDYTDDEMAKHLLEEMENLKFLGVSVSACIFLD
jgi:hypothetical protein